MSPEQACGDPVDHRTDLWAVGVVLYEMLAGRPPFAADFHGGPVLRDSVAAAGSPGTHRAEVSTALEGLVHRLLEKEPARRYADARALATDLVSVRAGGPTALHTIRN